MRTGTLILIPTSLGPDTDPASFSKDFFDTVHRLDSFIVEYPKIARQFLKNISHPLPLNQIRMDTLNEHTRKEAIHVLLEPLLAGTDVGLMSEAGYPCIADPGAGLVRLAHEHGIKVKPLVGPSAILLALAASGLNGQRFNFLGYLPISRNARTSKLRMLERESLQQDMTQIFIETPYRSRVLFENILSVCKPATLLCVAANVTCRNESIMTRTVNQWRTVLTGISNAPAVFLLYAPPVRPAGRTDFQRIAIP